MPRRDDDERGKPDVPATTHLVPTDPLRYWTGTEWLNATRVACVNCGIVGDMPVDPTDPAGWDTECAGKPKKP